MRVELMTWTARSLREMARCVALGTHCLGTGDPLLPQSQALNARWPGARLLELSGVNHDAIRAHGDVVAAVRLLVHGRRP